ncbi:tigger transposable element derived protein [Trichuris trichiura]|uniref:Tigger transposable element derived protein n=1 Tax=Trichuris trichiura TaxID=36087 RepID=A0A077ZJ25_TRITR|nr:tigger transposable element derived protein [Trichuris trichiura]
MTTKSSGPAESIQHPYQEIGGLAHQGVFGEINEEDIEERLEFHGEVQSNNDLLEIERQLTEDLEEPEPRNSEQVKILLTKDLSEASRLLENTVAILTEKDSQQERSAQVNRMITGAYSCYREIYESKTRHAQQTLDRFLQHR